MQEYVTTIYENEQLLKAVQVAKILNISRSLAYRLINQGQIPSIHIKKAVRVHPQDLKLYIKTQRTS